MNYDEVWKDFITGVNLEEKYSDLDDPLIKGLTCEESKKTEKANYYEKSIEDGNSFGYLALALLRNSSDAEEYGYIMALHQGNLWAYYYMGLLALEREYYTVAKFYIDKTLEKKIFGATLLLGMYHEKMKNFEKAEELYEKAIQEEIPRACINAGNLQEKMGRKEKAIFFYEKGKNFWSLVDLYWNSKNNYKSILSCLDGFYETKEDDFLRHAYETIKELTSEESVILLKEYAILRGDYEKLYYSPDAGPGFLQGKKSFDFLTTK